MIRNFLERARTFWIAPLIEGQKRYSYKSTNLRTLAYEEATRDTYREFEDEIKKCQLFQKLEIRDYCCQKLLTNNCFHKSCLLLEFGVFKGKSINNFADQCKDFHFYGFDSFKGLLEEMPGSGLSIGKFNLGGIQPKVRKNVTLISGKIQDTLPRFLSKYRDLNICFVHIDTDTYESSKFILENIKAKLVEGSIILFDEFSCYPGWREGEYKALIGTFSREEYEYIAFSQGRAAIMIKSP